MYAELARIYDRLMDDVDYKAWAGYYRTILQRVGVTPTRVCECACGTGSLTVELIRLGIQVTASDSSEEMLRVAQEKLRCAGLRAPVVRQDMRNIELPKPVDAVLCCCDGVNYLPQDKDALAFFRSAYKALRSGGALAFDVSTREKLAAMNGQFYCEEREDIAYIWKNTWDEESGRARMELSFYVRQPGGLYRRFEERHEQTGRAPAEICALLAEAGFTQIRIYGDRTFSSPEPGEQRAHFTAIRP